MCSLCIMQILRKCERNLLQLQIVSFIVSLFQANKQRMITVSSITPVANNKDIRNKRNIRESVHH